MGIVLILSMLAAQSGSSIDTFDSGTNPQGWSFAPWDVIETVGGNPNGWLHGNGIDTFYPILESGAAPAAPWVGNYTADGVTRISLDAQTISTDFPVAGGFQLTLLLRDTQGTVNVDDDDYAYFVGPEIPLPGNGWKHFDFSVPSRSAVSPPPGWKGGWSGDGDNFRPGVTWQSLLAGVNRVEIWWSDPTRFAIFQNWSVGVDNLEIAWEPALALVSPSPGAAGVVNLFRAQHALPGETVVIAASLQPGSANGRCNGRTFASGLGSPRLLGTAVADPAGDADVTAFVPSGLAGVTVFLQALNRDRCETSAVLGVTFQ